MRPTGYPEWASAGATNVTVPDANHQNLGFATNEQPPSSYFNWLEQLQTSWIKYLDQRASTPIVEDDFARGPSFMAQDLVWAGANASNYAIYPWNDNNTAGSLFGGRDYITALGGFGGWYLKSGAGVTAALVQQGGAMNNRNWRMEAIYAANWKGASGALAFIGSAGGAGFGFTTPSGTLQFVFTPSGGTPTQLSFSGAGNPFSLYAGTGGSSGVLTRLWVERIGATMSVGVGASMVQYMPGVAPATFNQVGMWLFDTSVSPTAVRLYLDYFGLFAVRDPV